MSEERMSDTSNSMEISLQVETAEFTLEDTLGILKDLKLDRDKELDHVYAEQINNDCFTPLNEATNVLKNYEKLMLSIGNEIANDRPDDYPIANTEDMYTTVIAGLDEEIENIQLRVEAATRNLMCKKEEIRRLKERNAGFEKMKEACLATNETIASKTYEAEAEITNEIFRDVKADTHEVVAELFPQDGHIREFLAELCSAYFAKGDEMYIDLTPEYVDAANFLLEADLIAHHRYDKNRVRLVDL